MPQSFARIYLHTVFSTKYRYPFLHPSIEPALYRMLGSRCRYHHSTLLAVGGIYDHVHLVHSLPRTVTIAKLMEDVKSVSSKWIKRQGKPFEHFQWQDGYASFSLDYRRLATTIAYVQNQKTHHYGSPNGKALRRSFEQEYERLLAAYDCAFDRADLFPSPPA